MIYATEQQVVVTAVLIVFCTLAALFTGIWYGRGRGLEEAAEEERWAQEQAKARRTHPVYREGPAWPLFERAHEAQLAAEDQAMTLANGSAIDTGEIQAVRDGMDEFLARVVYSAPTDYGAWLEREDGHAAG